MFCTLLALAFVLSHKSDAKEQVYELWKMRDDLEDLCSKDVALLSLSLLRTQSSSLVSSFP